MGGRQAGRILLLASLAGRVKQGTFTAGCAAAGKQGVVAFPNQVTRSDRSSKGLLSGPRQEMLHLEFMLDWSSHRQGWVRTSELYVAAPN